MEVETINYYGYMDIVAKLGGLKSILGPVLSLLTPFFVIVFLNQLSQIIKQSYVNEYFHELQQTIKGTWSKLNDNAKFKNYLKSTNKFDFFKLLKRQI